MTIDEINMFAKENDLEIVVFNNPSYESAIMGLSTNYEVIYDYDLMIEYLVENDNITPGEAIDFIEYNTIRALPYIIGQHKPIILSMKTLIF